MTTTNRERSRRYATTHAIERFEQRFHRTAPWSAWRDAVASIQARSGALLLSKDPDGTEGWLATIDGSEMKVVFDPATKKIKTVLTKDMKRWNRGYAELP